MVYRQGRAGDRIQPKHLVQLVSVGEAKSGVDFPPALLPLCDAAKRFQRSNKTYSVTHLPLIVTIS
ncbi:MAG: hypothetical protein ACRAVC_21190 [Trichormus sp.]